MNLLVGDVILEHDTNGVDVFPVRKNASMHNICSHWTREEPGLLEAFQRYTGLCRCP
jgi:hypothetical protein